MTTRDYDVVVLGTGPAGESAAMNAAKAGKRVAVVEASEQVGGSCTHLGTIPSKALRHAVKEIIVFNTNPMFRDICEPRWFSFPKLLDRANKVIEKQVKGRTEFYARNRIDIYFGRGKFIDAHTIEVKTNEQGPEILVAEKIVIATGSSPYRPADINFEHPRIYCSDTILSLEHTPRTIIIYGAGVIGCEYASVFCGLGVRVELINPGKKLLSFLDDEITDALSYHLRDNGVLIRHDESYEKVECIDKGVILHLNSGKKMRADAFLFCNGRSGNTHGLGLENVGIEANGRGQLTVQDTYQTSVDNIYAAGDVIGWPSLASAAYDQGRAVAANMYGLEGGHYISEVPTGIYTIPEISSIGKNEAELTAEKVPYEVGRAFFKHTARAQITGEAVGMLKILFHRESLELLGIHCFGDQASEIVHIGQAIMKQEGSANSLKYFLNTTFNYPTMAEAYRVAALNGFNRVV